MFKLPLLASVLVTTTLTAPAVWGGVMAVIEVPLITVTAVAEVPPNFTDAPARKPVPVMVTAAPPLVVPELGVIAVTVGAGFEAEYVKPPVNVLLCASVLTTMTFTAPATWAGVVAVIDVLLTRVTPVAGMPPRLTVAPVPKPVPVIVTVVPPLVVPVLGVMEATLGAGLDGGSGVAAMPPPHPGKSSASSNREQTGKQYLCDIRENLTCLLEPGQSRMDIGSCRW